MPTADTYVDEPYLSIRWDPVHQWVLSEWRTFATSTELRTGLLKGITAIKDNKAVAYLSDARKVKVIVHDDQSWIKECWLPLAREAGLKRIAFVTAASGLGSLTIGDVSGLLDTHGLASRTFRSMTEATRWVSLAHVSI